MLRWSLKRSCVWKRVAVVCSICLRRGILLNFESVGLVCWKTDLKEVSIGVNEPIGLGVYIKENRFFSRYFWILLLFKGKWIGKQHIKGKPHATGIKLWALADENGVMYHLKLYEGKEKSGSVSTRELVNEMVDKLPKGIHYVVFADQYFGGLDLAVDLSKKGYKFVLAAQSTCPSYLFKNDLDVNLKKGDFRFKVFCN